jgi:hypothetical protein
LVKPATDADTLHYPTSLVRALAGRVNGLCGLENVDFAVFHTQELNYLHLNTDGVRGLAKKWSALIPNAPSFPRDLGLVGIPYSQSDTFFTNCLLAHEIGHYIYQEKSSTTEILSIVSALMKTLGDKLKSVKPPPNSLDKSWCRDRVKSWAEELFCDLCACWLVGPVYSYSYVELSDLFGVLNPTPAVQDPFQFNESHPSDMFRLREQAALLGELGWWTHVKELGSYHSLVLQRAETQIDSSFQFSPTLKGAYAGACLEAFLATAPAVREAVKSVLNSLDTGVQDYSQHSSSIGEYLSHGVVPSMVVTTSGTATPGPVALVNAAYLMYADSLGNLIGRWTDRLELWVLKALDDNQLLGMQIT